MKNNFTKSLEKQKISEFGIWISPEGEILKGTENDGFPDSLDKHVGEFLKKISQNESSKNTVFRVEESCSDLSSKGEHPEWHHYEIAMDKHICEKQKIFDQMLDAGWVNISEEYKKNVRIINVNGYKDKIEFYNEDLSSLSRLINRSIEFIYHKNTVLVSDLPLQEPGPDGYCMNPDDDIKWFKAVEEFISLGYGWITKDQHLISCNLQEHLSCIDKHTSLKQYQSFLRVKEELAEAQYNLQRNKNGLDLAEYVRETDISLQNHREILISALYQDGWIRLGVEKTDRDDILLHAEGKSSALKKKRNFVEQLSRSIGAQQRVHKIDCNTEKMGYSPKI